MFSSSVSEREFEKFLFIYRHNEYYDTMDQLFLFNFDKKMLNDGKVG